MGSTYDYFAGGLGVEKTYVEQLKAQVKEVEKGAAQGLKDFSDNINKVDDILKEMSTKQSYVDSTHKTVIAKINDETVTLQMYLKANNVDEHYRGKSANEADFEHIRPPYGFLYQGNQTDAQFAETSAKLLRDKIIEVGADKIAAFIAEPVQGAGGVIIPPDGYFKHIQKICTEFDILFIADEVITGFGRTGNWFASQTMNLTPDLVTLAKGLTSGYVPMSAVLVSDKIASHLIEEGGEFYHGFTYSGHPVSAAVALANIELIETEGLIEHVRDITAPYLASAIKQLDSHPLVGQTRSFGLLACVELVRHKSGPVLFDPVGAVGTKCRDHAINNGLMVRAVRDGMILSPPLSFQVQDIDITIYKLKQALDATYAEIGNG